MIRLGQHGGAKVGNMADNGQHEANGGRSEPPAFDSPQTTPSAPAVAPEAQAVLVVDDKHSVRSSIAAVLRSEGYAVTEVWDGQDALPLLKTKHFDAMVLDLRMPLVGGALLLAALADPPPTIILSATQMNSVDRAGAGETIVAELTKPVAPQRLLDAVAAAVGGEGPHH